jgi:7,8-dihydropterin-6-yl-methyl-4-(beta-D-ribofuranosyl)aminobenzene 5'-phosphate synthase
MIQISVIHNEQCQFDLDKSSFSLLIQDNNQNILFDFGTNDEIYPNLAKKNLTIDDINYFILSHGHIDHLENISRIKLKDRKPLISHPKSFIPKFYKEQSIGFTPEIMLGLDNFNLELSTEIKQVTENVYFLGEIPTIYNFENKNVGNTCFGDDKLEDDSGLIIKTAKGLILVSGCAHSGICSMIKFAEKKFNKSVICILGGLHLLDKHRTVETIKFLKDRENLKIIYGHCVNNFSDKELQKIGGIHFQTLQNFIW